MSGKTVKQVIGDVWKDLVFCAGLVTTFVGCVGSAIGLVNAIKPKTLCGLSFTKSQEKPAVPNK